MKVNVLKCIFAVIVAIVVGFICGYVGITLEENHIIQLLGVVGFVFILIGSIYNIVKLIKKNKFLKQEDHVETMYNKVIQYQAEAKDFNYVFNKVNKAIKKGYLYIYAYLISLCLLLTALFNTEFLNIIYFIVIISVLIIDTIIGLFVVRNQFPKYMDVSKDYPYIMSILSKCKNKLKINEEIRLSFYFGDNIGVEKIGKVCYLNIGIGDLNILSDSELENIIYHELAHIYNEDTLVSFKVIKKASVFQELLKPIVSLGLNKVLIGYVCDQINEEVELFLHFIRIDREKKADLAVLEYGDKQIYINGLAKTAISGFQDQYRFGFKVYESEKPLQDYIEQFIFARTKNYLDNKEMYDKFLYNALQRKFDTHPSLKMRMDALGVEKFDINFDYEKNAEYQKEINKINEKMNQEWYNAEKDNWDKNREYYYLYYLKEFNDLKDKDFLSLNTEEQMKLAYCYYFFDDNASALKIYNNILELSPNNVFAINNRAILKYSVNDLTCIDDFEKACEIDHTLIEQNNFYIGTVLNNNGMEKEMEEYRARTLDKMKQVVKNYNYSYKHKSKAYEENDLSVEQRLVVANEVKKYPEIKEAYLLKQYINEEKHQYYLGIIFQKQAKDEKKKEIMDELFIFVESISDYRLIFNDLTYSVEFKNFVKGKKIKDLTK